MDSSAVKAHRCASGGKGGNKIRRSAARAADEPRRIRDRNAIERMLGRLKDFRRIATRYDRSATNFLAAVCPLLPLSPTGYEPGQEFTSNSQTSAAFLSFSLGGAK